MTIASQPSRSASCDDLLGRRAGAQRRGPPRARPARRSAATAPRDALPLRLPLRPSWAAAPGSGSRGSCRGRARREDVHRRARRASARRGGQVDRPRADRALLRGEQHRPRARAPRARAGPLTSADGATSDSGAAAPGRGVLLVLHARPVEVEREVERRRRPAEEVVDLRVADAGEGDPAVRPEGEQADGEHERDVLERLGQPHRPARRSAGTGAAGSRRSGRGSASRCSRRSRTSRSAPRRRAGSPAARRRR